MLDTDSALVVRRSVFIQAPPERVWQEVRDLERMRLWWGALIGEPEAGTPRGQRLITYEPRDGGWIEMEVLIDRQPARYGGRIVVFDAPRELTFENDWMPNQGWRTPTFITIRMTPALDGTVVEILHYGFERASEDPGAEHAGYESGWGMTQLNALRGIVEAA